MRKCRSSIINDKAYEDVQASMPLKSEADVIVRGPNDALPEIPSNTCSQTVVGESFGSESAM